MHVPEIQGRHFQGFLQHRTGLVKNVNDVICVMFVNNVNDVIDAMNRIQILAENTTLEACVGRQARKAVRGWD